MPRLSCTAMSEQPMFLLARTKVWIIDSSFRTFPRMERSWRNYLWRKRYLYGSLKSIKIQEGRLTRRFSKVAWEWSRINTIHSLKVIAVASSMINWFSLHASCFSLHLSHTNLYFHRTLLNLNNNFPNTGLSHSASQRKGIVVDEFEAYTVDQPVQYTSPYSCDCFICRSGIDNSISLSF